jgi:hypothetical protein
MFKVDLDSSEKVKMIGAPVSTQGEFPVSLAVSKTTNQVCVLNGGAVSVVSYEPLLKVHPPSDFFLQMLHARR